MLKRVLTLILALIMCSAVFVGCKKENEKEGDTGTASTNVTSSDDGIGAYDFGGADFTILSRSETSYEHIGNLGADTVSQAVFNRNTAVNERFNVNIKTVQISGGYDNRDEIVTAIRAENMSPTGAYDLISTHSIYLGWMGMEGLLKDLATLPEIDFTQDYWNQNLYNELNVDGVCYIMIGDIAHTLYEYISVMFVNTKILSDSKITENGIDGIYSMVDDGTWTWGKLFELSKDYGLNAETPTYGLLMNTHSMRASLIAEDAYIYDRDSNGKLYMNLVPNDHLVNAVQNLSKFFAQSNMYFADGWGMGEAESNPIFTAGNALFYGQILGQASNLSTGFTEYAVLPLPKFDEFQSDYYTICRDAVTAVAVMNCAKDFEMSGVITQALCRNGAEYVTPEYYEKALKYRYNSDPRCPEILDMIRNSLTIQPVGTYYETGIDSDMFKDIVMNGKQEGIAGIYTGYSERGNTELKAFYEKIEILKEG